MATTFDSISAQIIAYCERTDLGSVVESFINLAEQSIIRDTKSLVTENVVVANLTTGFAVYAKPTNWVRMLSFNFGSGVNNNTATQLILHDYEYIKQYWPDRTVVGVPKFYADYDFNHFILAPTPDQNYPFELIYLQQPTFLSAINQTNLLSLYASDLVFFKAMSNAMKYLMRDERVPIWESAYQQALQSFNGQDAMRIVDRAADRSAD